MRIALILAFVFSTAYAMAADSVFDEAKNSYSQNNYARSLELCQPAAEKGNSDCQALLGLMYWSGRGVSQDFGVALKWFHAAAEQGNAGAQFSLGYIDYKGQGVTQDYVEALKWFHKAAEQRITLAQDCVGLMYERGQGVQQDYVVAHMWLSLAAAQGDQDAAHLRDELAKSMAPAQIAEAQKMVMGWKPNLEGMK